MKFLFFIICLTAFTGSLRAEPSSNGLKKLVDLVKPALKEIAPNFICQTGCASCTILGCSLCYRRGMYSADGFSKCNERVRDPEPTTDFIAGTIPAEIFCKSPYALSGRRCVLSTIEGCAKLEVDETGPICRTCYNGTPTNNLKSCGGPQVDNCQLGTSNGRGNFCERCEFGYYLDSDSGSCIKQDGAYMGCAAVSMKVCTRCEVTNGWSQAIVYGPCVQE